ncbi:hypothetical protein C8R45DRAFT_932530 [Mycena sanguinolenta]|nr:hypothetical protein C8R45DRAFT_932530 [Mycena sanguinolenta]
MPVIPDETVSAAASKLSNKHFIAFLVVAVLATMTYYLWPSRLITVLLAAMNETRNIYRDAQQTGLPGQIEMDSLRRKVSLMVEETQHNSGSWPTALSAHREQFASVDYSTTTLSSAAAVVVAESSAPLNNFEELFVVSWLCAGPLTDYVPRT